MKERTVLDGATANLLTFITAAMISYYIKDTNLTNEVKVLTSLLAGLTIGGLEIFIDKYTHPRAYLNITAKQCLNIQRREDIANTLDNVLHPWKPIYSGIKKIVNKAGKPYAGNEF